MSRSSDDLSLVAFLLGGTILAVHLPGIPWPVEWAFGVAFLLVIPGYVIVASLFPRAPSASADDVDPVGWPARSGLTLVGSAVVVATSGVALATFGMFELTPLVLLVGGFSLGGLLLARHRRQSYPIEQRADPLARLSRPDALAGPGDGGGLNVLFVGGVVLFVGAVALTGIAPADTSAFSEAALVSESGQALGTGDTVTLTSGEANTMHLRLENHEGRQVEYTYVTLQQRVGPGGTVVDQEVVDRGTATVGANETQVVDRNLYPSMTGERLRLRYLVYKGPVPSDPSPENAALSLRVWVDVIGTGSS